MRTEESSIADKVSITSKNLHKLEKVQLTECVGEEIKRLSGFDITSYKVVASANTSQQTDKFTVKIVASAYGQTFVAGGVSNRATGIAGTYLDANSKLKSTLSRERDLYKGR